MMKPQEHIKRAEELCRRLRASTVQVGPRDRLKSVRGADPNELKKIFAFLLKHRDPIKLKKLLEKLPSSNFAKRSGLTEGYYKNIHTALGSEFYRLDKDDAIYILGWMCRLLDAR